MKKQIKDKASLRAFTQSIGKIVPVKEVFMSGGVIYVLNSDDGTICRLGIGEQPYYEYISYYNLPKESQLALQVFLNKYTVSENMKDLAITVKFFNPDYSMNESYECSRCGRELNVTMAQSYDGYNDMPICISCMDAMPSLDKKLAEEMNNYDLVTVRVDLKSAETTYVDVKVSKEVDNIVIRSMLLVAEYLMTSTDFAVENLTIDDETTLGCEPKTQIKCRGEYVVKPLQEVFAYTNVEEIGIIGYPMIWEQVDK